MHDRTIWALRLALFVVCCGASIAAELPCAPEPTNMPISAGDSVVCSVDEIGDEDSFRFMGAAGQRVLVEAVRHASGNPCVELFGPSGTRLGVNCSNQAARIDLTLNDGGQHVIRVSESNSDASLDYRLSLESLAPPSPTAPALQFGQAVTGEWDMAGGADLFHFAAAAGQRVLVEAVRHASGNPCVELFGPSGTRLGVNCSNQAARIDLTLNDGGQHVIRVSESNSDASLDYRLSLESLAPPSPTAPALQFGQAVTGEWDMAGGADLFHFAAAAGQRVLVEGVRHGGGNPCVELFGPSGTRLGVNCSNQAARIDLTLNDGGQHVIRVSESNSDASLDYRLSLESLAPPSPTVQPLQFDLGATGDLAAVGEADLFVVSGAVGDRIEPVVTRQGGGNPCVEVFDPSGLRMVVNCSNQSARANLTPTIAGPYLVRVSESNSDAILSYRIEVQCQGVCPPPPTVGGPSTPVTELSVDPGALFFTFTEGSAGSVRLLKVRNTGSDTAQISVEASTLSGGNWLEAVPESAPLDAGQSVSVSVRANPSGLPPGTYSGRITVRDSRGGNPVQAFVTMSVSRATRSVLFSQTGLTFSATEGGKDVSKIFQLLNLGVGALDWSLGSSTLSGGDWLTVTPESGSTAPEPPGSEVEVTIDPTGLAPGVYYGQVSVTAPEADNSPQSLTVVLNLLPADSPLAPEVDPAGLVFVGQPGVPGPEAQTISIRSPGNSPVMFTATASFEGGPEWFSVDPVSGSIPGGESVMIQVQPDATQLERGVFRGRLMFEFDGGFTAEAGLLLVVAPAAGAQQSLSSTDAARKQQAACTAEQLLPVFATPANSFRVQAGWPTPIEVVVVDDCGRALNDGAVQVSFSNGDAPLSLTPQGRGRWGRTWPARPSQQLNEVIVTADAVQFEPLLRGSAEIGGELSLEVDAPIVGSGAIISAASFDTTAPLAPGDLISIFGQKLAEAQGTSASLPLAKELSGTVVSLAGRRIPLLFVSENQINGMVPYGLPVNVEHEVLVRRGNTYALPSPVVLADAQPAVFTKDQTGAGQGIVVNAQGVLADAANPVSAGDLVLIFGAGFGEADPTIEAGEAVPSDPLSRTKHPATVTIGGIAAVVHFSGPTPGFTGLYQINATVPAGVSIGDSVPVVVSVSGRPGPPVTIAVR